MKLRYFSAGLLLGLCGLAAQAVPAYPGIIETRQPDGTPLSLRLHGDEYFSWASSADGYTLLRDGQGFWTLARRDASGLLVPTQARVSGKSAAAIAAANAIPQNLRMDQASIRSMRKAPARAAASPLQVDATFPTTGNRRLLMLLLNFADTQPTYTQEHFNSFMNAPGWKNIGSFRDFYKENSYGLLDVETVVSPWITLPGDKFTYNADNVGDMIIYALQQLAPQMDLSQFDNDGDGILDGLAIIHQGPGAEATGSTSDIWSHSSTLYGIKIGGVEVRRYTIQPEVFGTTGRISDIGVMTHEFGHNLGSPDFYDSDYGQSGGEYCGTGVWDLLGSGAWNGDYGDRPAHINMWQKAMFGWVEPVALTESQEIQAMPDATARPAAYRLDTTSPGDYFIIENRQQTGAFNYALPGHGMIITHVNEGIIAASVNSNTVNASYPQGCYTVTAYTDRDPGADPGSYGVVNSADSPFPHSGKTAFSDQTLPSTHAIDGRLAYKALSDIKERSNGTLSFTFTAQEIPQAPSGFKAIGEGADVILSWEAPQEAGLTGYNLYRNGEKIASPTQPGYTDIKPSGASKYTYTLDAQYSDGRLSPPVSTTLRLPQSKVAEVKGMASAEGVSLSWSVDPTLSRMLNPGQTGSDFLMREIPCQTIEYGHLFTADDLVTYQGTKIRRINFTPYQSLQACPCTIKVYEGSDGDFQVVSERAIKEMGTGIWNNILLTQTVEIKPGKDYMIAVAMEPKVGVAQLVTEGGDVMPGRGNLVKINDGEWEEDSQALGNFYLSATILSADSPEPKAVDLSGEADSDYDLFFPIGFAIYRDGQRIGESASRTFLDSTCSPAVHSYTLTTLYKGGSETAHTTPFEIDAADVSVQTLTPSDPTDDTLYTPAGLPASRQQKGILISTSGNKTIRK